MNFKDTCGPALVIGGEQVPEAGCASANYWAEDRWDPVRYFAARDREFKATVTVGALDQQNASPAHSKPSDTATSNKPETTVPQN